MLANFFQQGSRYFFFVCLFSEDTSKFFQVEILHVQVLKMEILHIVTQADEIRDTTAQK